MRLIELPSYPDLKQDVLDWLDTLPAGAWQWVDRYPFYIRINHDQDVIMYKLLFES